MKHSPSTQHLQKFVYIDSSEQQDNSSQNDPKKQSDRVSRECRKQPELYDNYEAQLQQIVKSQIDRIQHGQALVVPVGENEMEAALERRKQKYKWFLKQIEIDHRYENAIGGRVAQLKQQNKKKEQVLLKKQLQEQFREEQAQLKKYVIEKQTKQQKVISHLQQATHRLGMQRNVMIAKRLKSEVAAKRHKTAHEVATLHNKQKNELEELKNRYKEMKEEQRLNKLEQAKALRQLEHGNKQLKRDVQEKLLIKKDFIV